MEEKLQKIQKLLDAAEGNLASARNMLREVLGKESAPLDITSKLSELDAVAEDNIVEGVFDGEQMVATDGKVFPVPANYASKSKLIEGDGLKLTIAADGSFIYKQISPVERKTVVGTLSLDGSAYFVLAEGKKYKVLTASVTFYKAEPGDQVTAIIPTDHDSSWAALDNLLTKGNSVEPTNPTAGSLANVEPQVKAVEVTEPDNENKDILPNVDTETSQPLGGEARIEPPQTTETTPIAAVEPEVSANPSAEPLAVSDDLVSNPDAPAIEYPAGNSNLSDEQLLENLKSNLQNIETPAYVSPVEAATQDANLTPVDGINPPETAKPNSDQPIAELEI